MNNDKKKEVDLRLTIGRALAVFDSRDDFNLFLQKEDFMKRLSALSYLKPLEESNGKLIAHLYFRIPNRLSTLKNAFNYVHFDYDEEPKIDKFDETNELSKIIRDLQVKNNNIETIKKVIKYKDVSVQTLQTAEKAEIEAEKPVHEVPPLEEADSQFQLKRVKSERSESNHVKQAYEKLVDILQVMLPLVPSDLALELAPQLAVIEAARRGENSIPEEHPFSVSNFFGKDSEASVTSPILVPGSSYAEKDPTDPGLCTDKMNIEMESGMDPHAEEKKVDARVDPEERFYSTPPESQTQTHTLKLIAVQAPKHSTVRKIDQKKSVLDQIKYYMEVNHLRYEDIKSISKSKGSNRKDDHPKEWCEAIQHHSKQLKEWEQTLQNSHIYNYNNANLPEVDRIGWKGNLDISMEISNDFGVRDQFRKASSHWYVSFLIQFWKESPGISVSEIVKIIQEKRKNRTQNGLITWYADDLILLFQLMEAYLKKVYPHKIKHNIIKRSFEHSNSVENWEARIDSLLEVYTRK